MKNFFYLLLCLLVFSCSGPNSYLELKEIRVKKRGGEIELVEKLPDLKSFADTSNRLEIEYQFHKKNITPLKSGLLQVDNAAFFKLYLNDNLIVDNSSTFFMDTLLFLKKILLSTLTVFVLIILSVLQFLKIVSYLEKISC